MLKLEVGKKYLNRQGDVVEITAFNPEEEFPYYDELNDRAFTPSGNIHRYQCSRMDLVSEYVEPQQDSMKHLIMQGGVVKFVTELPICTQFAIIKMDATDRDLEVAKSMAKVIDDLTYQPPWFQD